MTFTEAFKTTCVGYFLKIVMVTRKIYAYRTDLFRSFKRSLWNVILTSRDAKVKSRGFPNVGSREVNITSKITFCGN